MLLESKTAVIYGGGGAIGGAVARAFAREGAKVVLAGRTLEPLNTVAKDIAAAGGFADVARVDALDEATRNPATLVTPTFRARPLTSCQGATRRKER